MAFEAKDLSVLAYANNFTMWHYTTEDADVTSPQYFNVAKDMLRVNDLIIANVDTVGTPSSVFYIVTNNDGINVSVTAYS